MAKFKVGDKVKWNDGKYYHDNKRIDVITSIISDYFGATRYYTKEINNNSKDKPKTGLAFESYLILA